MQQAHHIMLFAVCGAIVLGGLLAWLTVRSRVAPWAASRRRWPIMQQLAAGKLDVHLPLRKGDEHSMMHAIARTVQTLTDIIREVKSGAANLASAAQQLNATSESLAQSASESAAGIEETTAAIEEMSAAISHSNDNARVTEGLAEQAAREARQGGDAVRHTTAAMRQIADRIGIIDDIAYQTNLLALNAAIEAARAENTVAALPSSPVKCANWQSAARLQPRKSARSPPTAWNWPMTRESCWMAWCAPAAAPPDLVQEIAAATSEQATAVNQISSAVQQQNSNTQQNASASEELASTAEQMSSQAEHLLALMRFPVRGDGSAAEHPHSATPSGARAIMPPASTLTRSGQHGSPTPLATDACHHNAHARAMPRPRPRCNACAVLAPG
jgi:methyl-accepting chemotaxis protein